MAAYVIEASEKWPEGEHVVLYVPDRTTGEATAKHMRAMCRVDRRCCPPIFPAMFDPVGDVDGGPLSESTGIAAEVIGGAHFARAALDIIRAAFPGVRWQMRETTTAHDRAPTGHVRALFGCLDGRVVGVVAELVP